MSDLLAGEIGKENGVEFTLKSTRICKLIQNTDKTKLSLVIKITLDPSTFKQEGDAKTENLITTTFGSIEDLSTTDNIHETGISDIRFTSRGGTIFLNLSMPVKAEKQTTGKFLKPRSTKQKPEKK